MTEYELLIENMHADEEECIMQLPQLDESGIDLEECELFNLDILNADQTTINDMLYTPTMHEEITLNGIETENLEVIPQDILITGDPNILLYAINIPKNIDVSGIEVEHEVINQNIQDAENQAIDDLLCESSWLKEIPVYGIEADMHKAVNQDILNAEDQMIDVVLYEAVPVHITIDSIPIENNCELNQHSFNEDTSTAYLEHGDASIGEGSLDISPPLAETRQEALITTEVLKVMNVPTVSDQAKVDPNPKDGLLLNNKFSCDICPYQTNNRRRLMSHFKAHAATVSFRCNICSYISIRRQNLTCHLKKHSEEKPYSCDVDNEEFVQKNNFTKRIRAHSGKKSHSCDICNKVFNKKSVLMNHLMTHTHEKPHLCNVCNRAFSLKVTLTNHLRTHSGEKPYLCNVCNKTFSQRSHLTGHLKTHSGEKSYSCEVCNKLFTQKSNLTIHLRTHSSEKLYPCNACSKKFKHKVSLTKHFRKHSNEKPY